MDTERRMSFAVVCQVWPWESHVGVLMFADIPEFVPWSAFGIEPPREEFWGLCQLSKLPRGSPNTGIKQSQSHMFGYETHNDSDLIQRPYSGSIKSSLLLHLAL
ncbi:hypothetical protein R6Q59_010018 [Mikania micrantha]